MTLVGVEDVDHSKDEPTTLTMMIMTTLTKHGLEDATPGEGETMLTKILLKTMMMIARINKLSSQIIFISKFEEKHFFKPLLFAKVGIQLLK